MSLKNRIIGLAAIVVLWAVPLLIGPPLGSRDVYAYAAQGRLAAEGYDPYQEGPARLGPDDPVLAPVDPLYRDAPVPYGPVFVFASSAIAQFSGDQVVAQTELGTVAALNLFTGHIQWQAVYRQIPLPKTKNYSAPPRPLTWRLAPPVVVGEWVVTTPSDSNEILGLRFLDEWLERPRRDGFVDLFVGNLFDQPYLYRNRAGERPRPQHWLVVTVQGTVSNRDGIGTRLELGVGHHLEDQTDLRRRARGNLVTGE